jgi:subtilase family serine protease
MVGRESQAATSSYVLITFKQNSQKGAKAIFYVGNTVKALKGGESYTQTFDVAEKKIGVGRHVLVEADPYKKVSEASEDNNWRTLSLTARELCRMKINARPKR